MKRIFIAHPEVIGSEIMLNDSRQIHYLKDVLRLAEGQDLIIFDQQKNEYSCVIKKIGPDSVLIMVKRHSVSKLTKSFSLTVACAIPKKTSMDDIVDKLTQLGVDRIIPLLTDRVIVKLDEKKKVLRHKRWVSIAISAAQQSQRQDVPMIDPVTGIDEALNNSDIFDLKLIPHLSGNRKTLKSVLGEFNPRNIFVLIGPEGDFSPDEVRKALKSGCIPVSLGDQVLRVDTAAVAVASFIKFYEKS